MHLSELAQKIKKDEKLILTLLIHLTDTISACKKVGPSIKEGNNGCNLVEAINQCNQTSRDAEKFLEKLQKP